MQTKKYVILVDLLKKTDYNTKITKIESRTPSISGLATITALTAVENKISDVSNQFKKKQKLIMMQKYLILNLDILLLLITINLLKILLIIT